MYTWIKRERERKVRGFLVRLGHTVEEGAAMGQHIIIGIVMAAINHRRFSPSHVGLFSIAFVCSVVVYSFSFPVEFRVLSLGLYAHIYVERAHYSFAPTRNTRPRPDHRRKPNEDEKFSLSPIG